MQDVNKYLGCHLQSQSPSQCGSEGLCKGPQHPECPPLSAGVQSAQM